MTGSGGNIDITVQNIFGFTFRSQLTPENDITASSEFGVNGTVEINQFGVAPGSGLVELPEGLADNSNQVTQGCASASGNELIATGRGGVPPDPTVHVGLTHTWVDTRLLDQTSVSHSSPLYHAAIVAPLSEATAWQTNATGEIELVDVSTTQVAAMTATCASKPRSRSS